MFCTQCGKKNPDAANFCFSCGAALPTGASGPESRAVLGPSPAAQHGSSAERRNYALGWVGPSADAPRQPVSAESLRPRFSGRGRDLFSTDGLKMVLWYVSILGMPIGWLYTFRWIFKHVQLSTGSRLWFVGTGRQAYRFFLAIIGLSVLNRLNPATLFADLNNPAPPVVIALLWFLTILALQGIVYHSIFIWICASVQSSSGRKVSFVGKAWPYVCWTAASVLSVFTVVGWAWVGTAFLRWMFRSIKADGYRLVFVGSGFALLWRSAIYATSFLLILPIPWAVCWQLRWIFNNIEMNPVDSIRIESGFVQTAV